MGREGERWRKMVAPHFDFLLEHGFAPDAIDDDTSWTTSYSYRSAKAVVRVDRSNEFVRAEVSLIRLVDGEVPPYPIWVTSEPLHHTLLDNVLEARGSPLFADPRNAGGLDRAALERQLAFWSEALRTVAPDFLAGDLSAFDETEAVVRARVAESPQKIVSWLPEDAGPDEEAVAIAEMRAHVPPEVTVETRRYRRPH